MDDIINEMSVEARQKLQKSLYEKLQKLGNPTVAVLKKMVTDRKAKESKRLSKTEVLLALAYLKNLQEADNDFAIKWNVDYPLEVFTHFLKKETLEMLLKLFEQQDSSSSSLLPIKGISKVVQAKLRRLYIYDVPTLLMKGKTQKQRDALALSLDVDVKLVNVWVKQADLWRVDGMTPNTAYLLVQIGVRHVKDLSLVDVEKAYVIMERLSLAQPDFSLISKAALGKIIAKAAELVAFSAAYPSLGIEINEKEPGYLFRSDIEIQDPIKTPGEIIKEGLGFLDNMVLALSLPHIISGYVYMRKEGEHEDEKRPFPDAQVEISGTASPSDDKTEAGNAPSGYTDSEGKFMVIMPDMYSMSEVIGITISQGSNKQKFVRSASDIINAVKEQEMLNCFDKLDMINRIIEAEEYKLNYLQLLKDELKAGTSDNPARLQAEITEWEKQVPGIKAEIELQKEEFDKIKTLILDSDKTTNDLSRIHNNLLNRNDLEAHLGAFMLTDVIFTGNINSPKKALPSVKLMGNDEKAVHLSTDTAPSRVFSYGMLQRLVEPQLIKPGLELTDNDRNVKRIKMEAPVDVDDFKERIYSNPGAYPQMASLGIGYVLNMHQAWVPDGFALGSLLYSLILAPGEEQRLIVREKTQSYTVADDMEGSDAVSDNYALLQEDDTTAAYQYAMDQLSQANSSYRYESSSWGIGGSAGGGGIFKGIAAMFGLSGGYSKTKGKGSTSASQSNSHNEASSSAQSFQHSIKSASNKISQSKRISMRTATSEENDSVATKIIANHNHSHAMTIQYWEVMRRYRLETCIDGVELVLFVPLRIVQFLPDGKDRILDAEKTFDKEQFDERYNLLLKYADILQANLPYKYRMGINLIKKYAAYPEWKLEDSATELTEITLKFHCNLLIFDNISLTLVLKNGKGSVIGNIDYTGEKWRGTISTTQELKQKIRSERKKKKRTTTSGEEVLPHECTFELPSGVIPDDLSYIRIDHYCDPLDYSLYQDEDSLTKSEKKALERLNNKMYNLAEDHKNSDWDLESIAHFKAQLPEAFRKPNGTLSSNTLLSLGRPIVSEATLEENDGDEAGFYLAQSSSTINSSLRINIKTDNKILRNSDLQEIEMSMQHILSDALTYSQAIWSSLNEDERIMMFEQYTIDMDFDELEDKEQQTENDKEGSCDIPLLNCVDVNKVLGFYGNCMLLPFTYPQRLAEKLNKTAGEIQDSLYRYHTNSFRVPSTTISLPTDGMIGEAVLGETNVSEIIDLTRFWNWKDSPIDKMNIDSEYLNNTDYLSEKTAGEITALNLQSATAPNAVTIPDLISALVSKQTPVFSDITGLDQLKDLLTEATKSASTGRDKVLDNSAQLAQKALEYAYKGYTANLDSDNKAKREEEIKEIIAEAIKIKEENGELESLKDKCSMITLTEEELTKLAKEYCETNDMEYDNNVSSTIKIISKYFKTKESETPKTGNQGNQSNQGNTGNQGMGNANTATPGA